MFERCTTAFHFADSLTMNRCISSGVLPQGSMSNSRSRRLVSSPFAIVATACESRLMIAASVDFGHQPEPYEDFDVLESLFRERRHLKEQEEAVVKKAGCSSVGTRSRSASSTG